MPCANLPAFRSWLLGLPRTRRGARHRDEVRDDVVRLARGGVDDDAASSRRVPPKQRLRRLLVMLPWLMERGEVSVAEAAARFDLTEDEVVDDLELAAMCGLPPFVDELIDVFIDEGVIFVGVPRLFTRPLRLNSVEAFELLAAGRAAMELPGADPDGAARPRAGQAGHGARRGRHRRCPGRARRAPSSPIVWRRRQPSIEQLADRVLQRRPGRDDQSSRSCPRQVFADRGEWYVSADDERSGEVRTFRIDRIVSVEPTGAIVEPSSEPVPGARRLVRRCVRAARRRCGCRRRRSGWSSAFRSTTSRARTRDGWSTVTLPVASEQWLVRTLLRLGPEAALLEPAEWRAVGVAGRRPRAGALPALVERIEVDAGARPGCRRADGGARRRSPWRRGARRAAGRWRPRSGCTGRRAGARAARSGSSRRDSRNVHSRCDRRELDVVAPGGTLDERPVERRVVGGEHGAVESRRRALRTPRDVRARRAASGGRCRAPTAGRPAATATAAGSATTTRRRRPRRRP